MKTYYESLKNSLEQAIAYERGEQSETRVVRAIHITEGLKLFMQNKESCLEMEKKLNELGIKTRAGRNCEIDLWSIYVISVPENLIDTEVTL